MKVKAFIIAALCGVVLWAGATFVMVGVVKGEASAPDRAAWNLVALLIVVPLVLGVYTANNNPASSSGNRRSYHRGIAGAVLVEVIAGLAAVYYSVSREAPLWFPIALIALGILLTAVALVVGSAVRRRDAHRRPAEQKWTPVTPAETRHHLALVAVTCGAAFVLAFVVLAVLFALLGEGGILAAVGTIVVYAAAFALFAAGAVTNFFVLSLNRGALGELGGDAHKTRRVVAAVTRAKNEPLEHDEQRAAVRYAAIAPAFLGFNLGSVGLLYSSILLVQVQLSASGSGVPLLLWLVIAMGVAIIASIPFMLRRTARARHYEREHPEPVPEKGHDQ